MSIIQDFLSQVMDYWDIHHLSIVNEVMGVPVHLPVL